MQINIFKRNIFSEKNWWMILPIATLWLLTIYKLAVISEGRIYLAYFSAFLTFSLIPVVFYWRTALYTIPIPGLGLLINASDAHTRMFPGQWASYFALLLWVVILTNTFRMHHKDNSTHNVQKSITLKILSSIVSTALITLMTLTLMISIFIFLMDFPLTTRSFNQAIWLKYSSIGKTDYPCGYMATDLIQNHLNTNMTRNNVHKLLGKPHEHTSSMDNYYIGMDGAFFCIDPRTLDIEYRNGRVKNAYITEH